MWKIILVSTVIIALTTIMLLSLITQPVSVETKNYLVSVLSPPTGKGAIFYVALNGNDANPGTKTKPWRTIQKAAKTAVSGETVYIRSGTYREQVVPKNSGNDYITYAAYPSEKVTIDGSGLSLKADMDGLLTVSGLSNIRISGLRIINAGPGSNHAGILVMNSHHIIIEKNYTYNTTSSGIGAWGSSDVIIEGNDIELACNNGSQECLTVAGTNSFEVRNNRIHNSGPGTNGGGEGIDAKDGSSNGKIYKNHVHHTARVGIYLDAWDKHTHDIKVYQNIVHDISKGGGGAGIALGSEEGGLLENIMIYNNVTYHNALYGIVLGNAGDSPRHPMKNIKILNNTCYNNGSGNWGGGISIESPNINTLVIQNNICSKNRIFQISVEVTVPGLNINHNLIYGTKGDSENDGSNVIDGDPLFLNPTKADFHLNKNSPAINVGSSRGAPADDFDGVSRPQGKGYDMGAFENK